MTDTHTLVRNHFGKEEMSMQGFRRLGRIRKKIGKQQAWTAIAKGS